MFKQFTGNTFLEKSGFLALAGLLWYVLGWDSSVSECLASLWSINRNQQMRGANVR